MLFPEVRFYTNDSWGIIRGVAAAKGFPIVLMNHYSKGTLYLWTMPENFGDLYNLPQPMITRIKQYLFADAPVQIDAPDHVAVFTYDNGAFVVENFRDDPAKVTASRRGSSDVRFTLPPHSFRVFGRGKRASNPFASAVQLTNAGASSAFVGPRWARSERCPITQMTIHSPCRRSGRRAAPSQLGWT